MRNPMRNPEILWNPRTSFVVPRGASLFGGATGRLDFGRGGPHRDRHHGDRTLGLRGPVGSVLGSYEEAVGSVLGAPRLRSYEVTRISMILKHYWDSVISLPRILIFVRILLLSTRILLWSWIWIWIWLDLGWIWLDLA